MKASLLDILNEILCQDNKKLKLGSLIVTQYFMNSWITLHISMSKDSLEKSAGSDKKKKLSRPENTPKIIELGSVANSDNRASDTSNQLNDLPFNFVNMLKPILNIVKRDRYLGRCTLSNNLCLSQCERWSTSNCNTLDSLRFRRIFIDIVRHWSYLYQF